MSTFGTVWVIGEDPGMYAALCAVARRLGEQVEAIWIGDEDTASRLKAQGANALHVVSKQDDVLYEEGVGAFVALATERKPDVVLLASSKRMRLAAARLAAAMRTRVVNDASSVWIEDGALFAEHMVYGGTALARERVGQPIGIVMLSDGLLLSEPISEGGSVPAPEHVADAASAKPSGFKLVERRPHTVESVNLAAAKRVVSVGRGLQQEEDLELVEQLARALEAEVGCTRPIAEGLNWMARERYIGVSGAMLKPDLFVAVGLSGQVQHMVGANRAKTVVAINKDKNAPVFKQADYGMVGDLYAVVPKLVAELEGK